MHQIVSAVAPQDDQVFVEIGAGSGELTLPLARAGAGRILAVESEPALAERLRAAVEREHIRHVDVLEADFLSIPLAELLGDRGLERARAVGNLPYSVASPILLRLLSERRSLVDLTLTFQWEVAERLVARPGTKAYGFLTVMARQAARPRVLFRIPPQAFWPRPRVSSALVRLEFLREKEPLVLDLEVFETLVKGLLAHRRKNISNNLKRLRSSLVEESTIRSALADLHIDPSRRAETLAVEEFAALSHFCSSRR